MANTDHKPYKDEDFLFGKDQLSQSNGGNRLLRELILQWSKEYELADARTDYMDKGSKLSKQDITDIILAELRRTGARFLKKTLCGTWKEVGLRKARQKVTEGFKNRRKTLGKGASAKCESTSREPSKGETEDDAHGATLTPCQVDEPDCADWKRGRSGSTVHSMQPAPKILRASGPTVGPGFDPEQDQNQQTTLIDHDHNPPLLEPLALTADNSEICADFTELLRDIHFVPSPSELILSSDIRSEVSSSGLSIEGLDNTTTRLETAVEQIQAEQGDCMSLIELVGHVNQLLWNADFGTIGSFDFGTLLETTIAAMRWHFNSSQLQAYSCHTLALLPASQPKSRVIKMSLMEEGIDAVVKAMNEHSEVEEVQSHGSKALGNFAWLTKQNRSFIVRSRGVEAIVMAMRRFGSMGNINLSLEVQRYGCWALGQLALGLSSKNKCRMISLGGIARVLDAMRQYEREEEIQEDGCRTLSKLFDVFSGPFNKSELLSSARYTVMAESETALSTVMAATQRYPSNGRLQSDGKKATELLMLGQHVDPTDHKSHEQDQLVLEALPLDMAMNNMASGEPNDLENSISTLPTVASRLTINGTEAAFDSDRTSPPPTPTEFSDPRPCLTKFSESLSSCRRAKALPRLRSKTEVERVLAEEQWMEQHRYALIETAIDTLSGTDSRGGNRSSGSCDNDADTPLQKDIERKLPPRDRAGPDSRRARQNRNEDTMPGARTKLRRFGLSLSGRVLCRTEMP